MIIAGVLAFLCVAGLLALLVTPLPEWLANWAIDKFLEAPLRADLHIGEMGGNLFRGLSLREIEVRFHHGQGWLHIGGLLLRYDWRDFMKGRWRLQRVEILEPHLVWAPSEAPATPVERPPTGRISRILPTMPAMAIDYLRVVEGRLEDALGPLVDSLDLQLSAQSEQDELRIKIAPGHLLLPRRGVALENFSANLTILPEKVAVDSLRIQTRQSQLGLVGWVAPFPAFSCSLEMWTNSLSLDELSTALGMSRPLRGDVALTAQVQKDGEGWWGGLRLKGQAQGYEVSELSLDFRWMECTLEFDHLVWRGPGAVLKGRGHVATGGEPAPFGADLVLQEVDLSTLVERAPPSQLSGRILIAGNGLSLEALQAVADLDLSAGTVASRSFQGIRGRIQYDRGHLAIDQGLELDLEGAHLFLAGSLDVHRNLRAWAEADVIDVGRLLGRPELSGSLEARFQALGPVDNPALAGQLGLRDLIYEGQRLRRVRGNFGLSGAVSRQEGFFSLRFFDGLVGHLPVEEGLVRGRFAPQKVFIDSMGVKIQEGQLAASAELSFADGTWQIEVDPLQGVYQGYALANSGPLILSHEEDMISLKKSQFLLEAGSMEIQGAFGPGSQIQGVARLRGVQLEPLSPLWLSGHHISGPVSLDVAVEGTTQEPQIQASFQWKEGRFDQVTFDHIQADMAYANGRLSWEQLQAQRDNSLFRGKGYLPVDLSKGKLLSEESWDLAFSGEGNSPGFLPLLVKEVEDLEGPFTVQFHATGTPDQPRYEGFFNLRDGTLKLASLGNSIHNLTAQAHLDGQDVVIDRITGQTPFRERNLFKWIWAKLFSSKKRRRFEAFGRINLTDLAFDLAMRGKGLYVNYLEEKVEAEMDADLRVTGRKELHLSGQVDLLRGLITRSFKTPPRVAAAKEPPPYSLDVTVNVPKNCWVRNEAANIELRGQIRVLQQRGQLSLLGNLETVRGSYFFYGNNFRIQRGLVTFDELAEINPQLDVKAWTEVDRERIELTIGGRMRSPTITLTSYSGYSERDIITLLTLHQSPAGLDTLGAEEVVASQAGDFFGSFIQEAFNRKASSILGVDKFTVKPGPSGLHLRGAEITLGTYLSSEIYVEYSRRLSQESGEQVGVEYSLSRNLSLQGNRDALGLYRVGFILKWDY